MPLTEPEILVLELLSHSQAGGEEGAVDAPPTTGHHDTAALTPLSPRYYRQHSLSRLAPVHMSGCCVVASYVVITAQCLLSGFIRYTLLGSINSLNNPKNKEFSLTRLYCN